MGYAKKKARFLLMAALIAGVLSIAGFHAGVCYAVETMQVGYDCGIVEIVINGHVYEHIAESGEECR